MTETEKAYHDQRAKLLFVEAKVQEGHTAFESFFSWQFFATCRAWSALPEGLRDQLAFAQQAPSHFPEAIARSR